MQLPTHAQMRAVLAQHSLTKDVDEVGEIMWDRVITDPYVLESFESIMANAWFPRCNTALEFLQRPEVTAAVIVSFAARQAKIDALLVGVLKQVYEEEYGSKLVAK